LIKKRLTLGGLGPCDTPDDSKLTGEQSMTAHAVPRLRLRRKSHSLLLSLALLVVVIAAAAAFVFLELRPTWPAKVVEPDAPAVPVTVGGVLFDVPPAAIRVPVQRHPGAHERIDLVFLWPSLTPPAPEGAAEAPVVSVEKDALPAVASADRLFVTIAGLGAVLPPAERLRSIYPRYFATEATAGPDGLAVLPFRTGTPYEGEDLIYFAEKPEAFFARCTRTVHSVPGTCVYERLLDAAEITLRFPRQWLQDWRSVATGFDRLIGQLHPKTG
jgi:hypothetical protein